MRNLLVAATAAALAFTAGVAPASARYHGCVIDQYGHRLGVCTTTTNTPKPADWWWPTKRHTVSTPVVRSGR